MSPPSPCTPRSLRYSLHCKALRKAYHRDFRDPRNDPVPEFVHTRCFLEQYDKKDYRSPDEQDQTLRT